MTDLRRRPDSEWDRRASGAGLGPMLLRSAFRKSVFLRGEARRGHFVNVDLFQCTGRRHTGDGDDASPAADALLPGLVASLEASR